MLNGSFHLLHDFQSNILTEILITGLEIKITFLLVKLRSTEDKNVDPLISGRVVLMIELNNSPNPVQ